MADSELTPSHYARDYALCGIGFGILFPMVAHIIDAQTSSHPLGLSTFLLLHHTQPLHYIIDLAPLFLGSLAYLGGSRQDRIVQLYQDKSIELVHRSEHQQETAEALGERDRMLDAIKAITQEVNSTVDLDKIVDTLSHQIVESGILKSLMVALVDHDLGKVRVVTSINTRPDGTIGKTTTAENPKGVGVTYDLESENITAETARTGVLKIVEEWDDRFDTRVSKPGRHRGRVAYFIPIVSNGKTLAVLATGSTIAERETFLSRIESMAPLFRQVAVAFEHAFLVRDLRNARDHAESSSQFVRGLYEIASNDQWDIGRQPGTRW